MILKLTNYYEYYIFAYFVHLNSITLFPFSVWKHFAFSCDNRDEFYLILVCLVSLCFKNKVIPMDHMYSCISDVCLPFWSLCRSNQIVYFLYGFECEIMTLRWLLQPDSLTVAADISLLASNYHPWELPHASFLGFNSLQLLTWAALDKTVHSAL